MITINSRVILIDLRSGKREVLTVKNISLDISNYPNSCRYCCKIELNNSQSYWIDCEGVDFFKNFQIYPDQNKD